MKELTVKENILRWMNAYIPTGKTIPVFEDMLEQYATEQRDAGARKVELTHFVWCPQCGDALEQTGTQNKYNCFGCDTDYQLKALTPPTK